MPPRLCAEAGAGCRTRGVDHDAALPDRERPWLETQPRPDAPPGPMELFTASGRLFPVVVIACVRTETLRNTLSSLLSAGASPADILVAQDGANSAVASVVAEFGVAHKAKRPPLVPLDGAQHIARVTTWTHKGVRGRLPDAPAVLVVEDDLVVSKDFFDHFRSGYAERHIPRRQRGMTTVSKRGDPGALRRTGWFPGLGWLPPRVVGDVHPQWPDGHRDHWMRSDEVAGEESASTRS